MKSICIISGMSFESSSRQIDSKPLNYYIELMRRVNTLISYGSIFIKYTILKEIGKSFIKCVKVGKCIFSHYIANYVVCVVSLL